MYDNKKLFKLIIPLIIEQLLVIAVGLIDSIMVAGCGETAISAVSLINSINNLLIMIISALAAGGSIVTAHAIGRQDRDEVNASTGQLFLLVTLISTVLGVCCLILNGPILNLLYGSVEQQLMSDLRIYFFYSAISYPFLGIYNAGASLFRAAGDSKIAMYTSLASNIINIMMNALLIYVLGMGVAGAAIATLISRIAAAFVIIYLMNQGKSGFWSIFKVKRSQVLSCQFTLHFDKAIISKILSFGVPNSLENGFSQIGKLILSSLTASFGTIAVTADSVTCNVGNLQLVPSMAIMTAMITVVGQAYGAGDFEGVVNYTKKLVVISHISLIAIGLPLFLLEKAFFGLYALSPDSLSLAATLLTYNIIMVSIFHPESFALASALRAIGDVKYTMYVAILSLWLIRIPLSYFLSTNCGLGVFGIWIAMSMDWVIRSAFFIPRFKYDKKNRLSLSR